MSQTRLLSATNKLSTNCTPPQITAGKGIGAARIQGLEKDLGMNPLSNQFNIATGMRFDKCSNGV